MRAYSVDEVGAYLARGYWASTGGWYPPTFGEVVTVSLSGLTAANQTLARLALDAWTVLGFEFQIVNSSSADILLSNARNGGQTTWDRPGGLPRVNVGPDFTNAYGSAFGSYTYQSWLHEIGHALGLGHTGAYNGTGTYGIDNLFTNDSWQMSVMSYFPQDENTSINASFAYVLTPMPGDIAAIGRLYDLDQTAGAGNTIYFWGTNATGIYGHISRQIVSGALKTPFTMTIVDRGGYDTLNFIGSNQPVTIDLRPGTINSAFGLRGNILIERNTLIERVVGSGGDDVIRGNHLANLLQGGAGNDLLEGRLGNDILAGGPGNDTLLGGPGNDTLRGGPGLDIVDGGAGIDRLRIGDGGGVVDLIFQGRNTGEAAGDRLISIEEIEGGAGVDALYGDHGDNRLLGLGGHDRLEGRGGNDTLEGGAGNDTLIGGMGDDLLFGGPGADLMDGGPGRDTALYAGSAVRVDLANSALNAGAAAGDVLINIENVTAGNGNDTLRGNGLANVLTGNGGNDLIEGRWGNDTLFGGAGNDTLIAGPGNDVLWGGPGNDRLVSDYGNNTLHGGIGADEFVFQRGRMTVVDFTDDVDTLVIDRAALGRSGLTVDMVMDAAEVRGGATHIDLGGGRLIVLQGITDPDILRDDLILL